MLSRIDARVQWVAAGTTGLSGAGWASGGAVTSRPGDVAASTLPVAPGSAAEGEASAWSPGPLRRRCRSSSLRSLKAVAAVAALLVCQEPRQASLLVAVEPGVQRVGVAGSQQPSASHRVRRGALGHLEY